ncbi:MAG: hypothetical protein DMF07_12760 [Verrucomicrobia bacterium]|nr:MAG: hypothetical protein DMF07_12760 [Verrucomicrobiota bacterium]
MSTSSVLHSAANKLYQYVFPIYRLLYAAYKTRADRAERELLKQILFPGAVVVDVGANIGIYSEFLSRCVGPTGLVHSFEPSPDNFRRLRVATRNLSNVRLSQAAVGERSGESKLYISKSFMLCEGPIVSWRTIPMLSCSLNFGHTVSSRPERIGLNL